jgi:hypothetical protein
VLTKYARVAQLAEALVLETKGCWFESSGGYELYGNRCAWETTEPTYGVSVVVTRFSPKELSRVRILDVVL